jgi:hypothetical protein
MDPIACWRGVCEYVAAGKLDDACWLLDDLYAWLKGGGFRPDGVPWPYQLRAFQRCLRAVLVEREGGNGR